MRPYESDYHHSYKSYVGMVKENDCVQAMEHSIISALSMLKQIPEAKADFRYAPEKWTVKQVVAHIIDTERVMTYRALRFARNDSHELAGFDEKQYSTNTNAENRTMPNLIRELELLRASNLLMFSSFNSSMLSHKGVANNCVFTVNALGYILAGHLLHHCKVLEEKYL